MSELKGRFYFIWLWVLNTRMKVTLLCRDCSRVRGWGKGVGGDAEHPGRRSHAERRNERMGSASLLLCLREVITEGQSAQTPFPAYENHPFDPA